jgi:CBS domain-containing protein
MGSQSVKSIDTSRAVFTSHLLSDIQAMEWMLSQGLFEKGHQRIGAEQEIALVNAVGRPSMNGPELLEELPGQFTTEIGQFNLELNLDPYELNAEAFRKTEEQLRAMLGLLEQKSSQSGSYPLLTGIIPSLHRKHLDIKYMTPRIRYQVLSEAIRKLRGTDFEIHIQGADELMARLDSVMYEACNTSWQLHLQIDPHEFVEQYNWAQYISGPVLAATANSPLLFGRELWHETRIALFQQSIDTRSSSNHLRDKLNRVTFGRQWLNGCPSDVFKDNISHFPAILTGDIEEDAMEVLSQGGIPKLKALRLHNGTVYSWNRPCYGISDTGYPHLRIENRYVPSGPSIPDAIANLAFWIGLMKGMPSKYGLLSEEVPFKVAKANFYRAARSSLFSAFNWDGRTVPASQLIVEELVPIAEDGLRKVGLKQDEINRYLAIIERRAILQQNGATWMIKNFRKLADCYGRGVAVQEITQALLQGQRSDSPVHEWPDLDCNRIYDLKKDDTSVERVMKTDLFTIHEDEPVALVKAVMNWKHIRHLPVEDDRGRLVGLITKTNLENVPDEQNHVKVKEVMTAGLITVERESTLDEGAVLLKKHGIGCLPVVENEHLIGLLTDTDFRKWYGSDF